MPLHVHLADSAAVAGLLWDHWLPEAIVDDLNRAIGDPPAARALVTWLAGAHDAGKASPAFVVQVPELTSRMADCGLVADPSLTDSPERREVRHELVSHIAAEDFLVSEHAFPLPQARKLASVLASHHGRPPSVNTAFRARDRTRLVGNGPWTAVRRELLANVTSATTTDMQMASWRSAHLAQHHLVLLSAVVIVADWIASSSAFELLAPGSAVTGSSGARAAKAWRQLDLPSRWTAHAPADADLFPARFELTAPRPVQLAGIRAAREAQEPGLMILEADTGIGKTETALAMAEILAERFHLGGIFIGLPTQATADGMYARVSAWAEHLGLETPAGIHLAHGKADLNHLHAARQQEARFRSIDRASGIARPRGGSRDDTVIAHEWFSQPKRGPLSSFVIGTVDQALVAALRSKHVMLRHLALAGKVVILDEVHAHDTFMSQYTERLLHWLGVYRVPVILLSATLPAVQRRALVAAYAGPEVVDAGPGRRERMRARLSGRARPVPGHSSHPLDGDIGYPSITTVTPGSAPHVTRPPATTVQRHVAIERIDDDPAHLTQLLVSALADGGVAIVIRNTVRRVQDTAQAMRDAGLPVLVAHARFLAVHRAAKDRELLRLLGKDPSHRPARLVLVASQVVEQSLDIDADLMVSDLAPIDLLIQRVGRLHRHSRPDRPPALSAPRLLLTGTEWGATPPEPIRASSRIYGCWPLLRTLAALDGRRELVLPKDIPHLVQAVYDENLELGPSTWRQALDQAHADFLADREDKQYRAKTFRLPPEATDANSSLLGWLDGALDDPATDELALGTVRDGTDALEVLVIRRGEDGVSLWTIPGDDSVPQQLPDTEAPTWALTQRILASSIRLPGELSTDQVITELEHAYPVPAWHTSHRLRGKLVLTLDAGSITELGGFHLAYDSDRGLRHERIAGHRPPPRDRTGSTRA